jgi:hypothetical protein
MLPFRKELFWDIEFFKLDPEIHKRLIIERILTLGNLDEFHQILKIYNEQTVIDIIHQLGYLDPKTLRFVISYFKINKNELKCCTKKQSTVIHWG